DDHQTGVLTDKLIEQSGLSPQRIVRMAIADLYQKQQAEIPEDRISTLTELITDEASDTINWESKQQEFESLLQKDTEDTDSKYPEESDIDLSEDVQPVIIQTPVSEELEITLTPSELATKLQFLRSLPIPFNNKDQNFACEVVNSIVSTCDTWESIATVTQRDSMSLSFVIGFLDDEHKAWLENLPKLLAEYAVVHPEELIWVDGVIRTRALAIMGFEVGSKVEVITDNHSCFGRRGHVVDLSIKSKIPIGVRFPGVRKYFYYTDLKLVGNQHQDTAASEDISNKVEILVQATGWEEVILITQNWAEELKSTVWKALSEEERQSIKELKNQHFENLEKMPQVGDKVIWNDESQTYV
ncbi:MAG: hypothetical protein HC836_43655, partial [Richelia sp. RM2_1_2]|nr:hypothetical protein [Richelia sp. RM1_1_1]NJO64789.1 hypothetical protein [Richelia sp. RM2_1_2]